MVSYQNHRADMATLIVIDTITRETDISFTPGAFYAFGGRFLQFRGVKTVPRGNYSRKPEDHVYGCRITNKFSVQEQNASST